MINARAESIWTKPAYRVAARKQRCLIPASCFFEWQKKGENSKQPYCIRPKDNTLFSFAGIWETWREKDTGKTIFSCAIITTRANTALQNLHDRMPVIVTEKDYDLWLDRSEQPPEKLQHLLEPISSEHLAIYAVSQTINTPANDSAELIDPIDED
jgi:putative SOS response-associated peptidase YedK